jgi:phage tail-like protein
MVGKRTDPYLSFNFLVEIEGVVTGGFSEVSGLTAETEIKEYREGGLNEHMHRLAGPTRYPTNLVLKRGLTDADTLFKWYQDVIRGTIQRKNGSIVLLDAAGGETWRWNFTEAYPVKWIGPSLRGVAAEVAVETLEMVHNGIFKA